MRNSTRAALAIGLGLVGVLGFYSTSLGQQAGDAAVGRTGATQPNTPRPATPAMIATIDVDKVLQGYDKFRAALEQTNADALARKDELMKLASEAQGEGAKLQKMAPGSMDQKKIEDKITSLKAQFEAGKQQAQMDFERREAAIMAEVFNDVQSMSGRVAKSRGANMVVKYSPDKASATDPKSIEAIMFRALVYSDPQLDLTRDVTYYLNQEYKAAGGVMPKGPAPGTAAAAAMPRAANPAATAGPNAAPTQR